MGTKPCNCVTYVKHILVKFLSGLSETVTFSLVSQQSAGSIREKERSEPQEPMRLPRAYTKRLL